MTAIEWIKYELRQRVDTEHVSALEHKINFVTDVIIHAKEPSIFRFAQKYHGLLCHFDEIQKRASKALAGGKKRKSRKAGKDKSRDSAMVEAESSTKTTQEQE